MWLFEHFSIFFVFAAYYASPTDGAKILGITFVPSISHQEVYQPIWKELSLRGHNVTVMATNVLADPKLVNLTEIDLGFTYKYMANLSHKSFRDASIIENVFFVDIFFSKILQVELASEQVQKFLNKTEESFDLVVVEALHPLVFGFAAKYKAPVVGISSLDVFLSMHDAFGNPTHPLLRPDAFIHFYGEPTFSDRFKSFVHNFCYRALYYWRFLPEADKVARRFFGSDIPYLGDVIKNTSLLLINSNPIVNIPAPNVPGVVTFGNLHIKDNKTLPKNLQDFLDSSTRGVVYFSLGSNWDDENVPEHKPDNILFQNWMPQQDILAHQNVKVFVTQGGLQSIEQAVHYGVPLVGIPIFGDQPTNVKILVDKGMAIHIDFKSITVEKLKQAIIEIGTNKKYKQEVLKSREILLDRPMNELDKVIWWIEHVIRHKGAKHLRSPAADMSFFHYFMLDNLLNYENFIFTNFSFLGTETCSYVELRPKQAKTIVEVKWNRRLQKS
ncbi:hypothetical protein JTB14_031737 [Gonioctena quinquepunctata]|nr:hypothetical protein JTB14_031737 [Gonioctena quinquepunctata]